MNKLKTALAFVLGLFLSFTPLSVFAEDFSNGFFVSPPNQNVILTPGETTDLTVSVSNPSSSTENFNYIATVVPYSITSDRDDGNMDFSTKTDYNDLVDWITLENEKGTIAPNNTETIIVHINVPADASAEGQYAAISVTRDVTANASEDSENSDSESVSAGVSETWAIASIIYATVAGDTQSGYEYSEVSDLSIPGFFSTNKITASSKVKNTGNVHQTATYKLSVFPLFSNEEVYTNEEDPETATIMPGQTLQKTITWDGAAPVGLYRVVESVSFGGHDESLERFVLVCPVWLLLVIVFVVIALIVWLIAKIKGRK